MAEVPQLNVYRIGSAFALKRMKKLKDSIHWMYYSDYKQSMITRAYHDDNNNPCALYRAEVDKGVIAYGESLIVIKDAISRYRELGIDGFEPGTVIG